MRIYLGGKMNNETHLPILYGLSSKGKLQQWQVKVQELSDGTANLIRESGYVNGKIKQNIKRVKKGVNIGKSNETTPLQQAINMAHSELDSKRNSNYELNIDPNDYVPRLVLPQLASKVKNGKIKFPCDMQPKLNGICCIARKYKTIPSFKKYTSEYISWALNNKRLLNLSEEIEEGICYHSRGGQLFHTLEHLTKPLFEILSFNEMVHGELYNHDWSLQKIGSYTKDLKKDAHKLEYWIYDYPNTNFKWRDRLTILREKITDSYLPTIKLVPTVVVRSYEEAKEWHDVWVAHGYEGGMLRNHDGFYIFEYNSKDLEKVKEFEDAEFEIIGGKEGTGNDEGCVVFRCVTPEGIEFDVRPKGTVERRRIMFENLHSYIGESLTVRFAEYSDDKVPLQPVGIAIRNYE